MLDVGHPPVDVGHEAVVGPQEAVDVADESCLVKRRPDEGIHLTGRIDLAHPVVAIRPDAEPREDIDEDLGVVAGVRGVAVRFLVGDLCERPAHRVGHGIGRQERLGVHRVHVVDPVEVRRLEVARAHRADDDVEENGAPEAADMDGSRRRLRVVDDLRPADTRRELVSPIHGLS